MKRIVAQLLVLTLAIPAWTAGCYKRVEIPREQLVPNAVLPEKEGPYFIQSADKKESPAFRTIQVSDTTLVGELQESWRKDPASFPLDDVTRVEKKKLDPGLTTLAVLGGCAGAFAIVMGILLIAMASMGDDLGS